MDSTIVVALIGLAGSALGSLVGVLASQKLTQYRLQELEKKVDKHNNLLERMYIVEGKVTELEHDVRDLKGGN
jgi:hypothetical protein